MRLPWSPQSVRGRRQRRRSVGCGRREQSSLTTSADEAASTMVGEALRPVDAVAGEKPDAGGVSAHHQAIAVMLDFVNPVGPGRRLVGSGWEAGLDEAGRGCPARA